MKANQSWLESGIPGILTDAVVSDWQTAMDFRGRPAGYGLNPAYHLLHYLALLVALFLT